MKKETLGCSFNRCSNPTSFLCSTHQIQFCTPHMFDHIKQIQSNHKLVPISILTLSQSDLQVIREAQKCLTTDWQQNFTLNLPQFQSENLDSTIKMFTKRHSQELSHNGIYLRKEKDLFKKQKKYIEQSISLYLDCFKSFVNSQIKNQRLNLLDELQILKNIQIQKTIYPVPNNQIMICTHFAKIRKKLNQNYSQNIFKSNWRKGVLFLRQQLELLYNYPQKIQQHILNNKRLSDEYLKAIIDFANQKEKQKLFSIVLMSKNNKNIKYASGKCITILNKSGFPLLNRKNLQGIQIPYSDLSKANFSFSNLQGSNLQGSILQGANLTNTNLDFSNLEDIFIQQGSRIFLDHSCIDFSICGTILATGGLDSKLRLFEIPQNILI